MASWEVEIRLLGSFELRIGGAPVAVPPGQQRALLAALALGAGRVVATATLIDVLWREDLLPRDPRAGVQNNVQRLRRAFGPCGGAIVTVADGYLLDVPDEQVDARHLVRLADQVGSGGEDRRVLIDRGLALWRGEPLSDVGSPSLVHDHAAGLLERHLTLLEARADDDIRAARYAAVIADLQGLTTRFPLRESLWARLLDALAASGRLAEALETYERLRTNLLQELSTDPSPELRQIHQRLLTTTATGPAPARPPAPAPADTPRQLPHRTPGFIGRESELTTLDRFGSATGTESDPPQVTVIHGPAGIGKTALAVQWGYRARTEFPDGQVFLDLRGFGPGDPLDPGDALGTMLRSVGLSASGLPADTAERSALLRTVLSGRRLLVVLDNARDAGQVRPLLPGSGHVVLVTSRNRLRGLTTREGALALHLSEMAERDAITLLTQILGTERVEADPTGVAGLVELCGGIPLALRIAAQHAVSAPGVPAPAGSSPHPLEALSGDEPATDLRTVFSWSYDALAPAPARLFRRLGIHPGPAIDVSVAAILLDTDPADARRTLDQLVAAHLLEEVGSGRCKPHDLVHRYAIERLDADEPGEERENAFRRLLDWYVHAANASRNALGFGKQWTVTENIPLPAQPLPAFADRDEVVEWSETERAAVVDLARVAAARGHDDHVWLLSRGLQAFLARYGHNPDRVVLGELAVAASERQADPEAISESAYALGSAYSRDGRHESAIAMHGLALRHAIARADDEQASLVLGQLGISTGRTGDYEEAAEHHRRSVSAARRTTRPELEGHALLNFGSTAATCGRHTEAIGLNGQALAIYRRLDFGLQAGLALGNLAENHEAGGQYERAIDYARATLDELRDHRGHSAVLNALAVLARVHSATGETADARAAYVEALGHLRPGDPRRAEIEARLNDLDTGA